MNNIVLSTEDFYYKGNGTNELDKIIKKWKDYYTFLYNNNFITSQTYFTRIFDLENFEKTITVKNFDVQIKSFINDQILFLKSLIQTLSQSPPEKIYNDWITKAINSQFQGGYGHSFYHSKSPHHCCLPVNRPDLFPNHLIHMSALITNQYYKIFPNAEEERWGN